MKRVFTDILCDKATTRETVKILLKPILKAFKERSRAKASACAAITMAGQYLYVARLNIRSYYEIINHVLLLKLIEGAGESLILVKNDN